MGRPLDDLPPLSPDEQERLARGLVEGSGDLAGAAIGGALGLIGGPPGVVFGATGGVAVQRMFRRVGSEIVQRVMSRREETRVGAATAWAAAVIAARLDRGEKPRDDILEDGEHPRAEEVLEGCLLRARDSFEERKVRHLGVLYGNLTFQPQISLAYGTYLIGLISELTYRQLAILAVAADEDRRGELRDWTYRDMHSRGRPRQGTDDETGLLCEIYDLDQRGLIRDATGDFWLGPSDIRPSAIVLQGAGGTLAWLAALDTVPAEDRAEIYKILPRDSALAEAEAAAREDGPGASGA